VHVTADQTIWPLALFFTLYAGYVDGRTRRIPNRLTVTGFSSGLALHALLNGWKGAVISLEGTLLALAILLPLVLLRALGAGDWKLMGALGSMLGPWMLVFALLASIFVAGFMAVLLVFQTGRVRETARNIGDLVKGFFVFGLRAHPEISLDNPDALKLPFGVAAAFGTLICFVAAHWHLGI
jgi:prepilin peptidase CpaA